MKHTADVWVQVHLHFTVDVQVYVHLLLTGNVGPG